ncbi:MAG: hypothetical protein ABIH72_04965 [archaeon]
MKSMKKGSAEIIIVSIILIVIILVGIILIFYNPKDNDLGSIFNKDTDENPYNPENNPEPITDDSIINTSSGGGGGGGDSGGSSTDDINEDPCIVEIPYIIKSFIKNQVCNLYDGSICIDKTITCSAEVKNFDDEISGIIKIELTYSIIEGQELYSEILSTTLDPGQQKTVQGEYNVQSTGIDGNANKELDCIYHTLEIPTKKIC